MPSTPAVAGRARRRWAIALACVSALAAAHPSHAAGTYYVDGSSPSCSNSGPGTATQPYCSITAAVSAHKGAGITIIVRPGVYPEQVTVPASGSSASSFVLQAQGGTVVVDGADDFGSAAKWVKYSGNVWLAASVTWSPKQVFADGARLAASGASPASLPAGSYRWVSKQGLYVNMGGGNPGDHQARVGHRASGFVVSGRSYVTLDGFTVTRTEDRAIYLSSCSNCTITHNTVNFANKYGIEVKGGSGTLIGSNTVSDNNDHGIGLTAGATGITVEDNESFRNARPSERAANGIYLYGSPGNVLRRNRLHDNQDTGLQINTSSNNCIAYLNRSWNNGDHGYDHLQSTGTIHVCDVAYGNYKDGFSIEGSSSGTRLYDCIAVENGLTTGEFDLWVDQQSSVGFASNYNIFWNSSSQPPVKYVSTQYSSVAAYSAASGQDAQTLQADPRFASPAAGDFHLLGGSPAIDSGNSGVASWPATDAEGNARVDDPATPNTGVGPVAFSERGALEFSAFSDRAPVVGAPGAATVAEGAPLAVDVTAADPDGDAIGSLTATGLPPGATFSPGPGNTTGTLSWAPAFDQAGTYTVTFTVANALSGSASTVITVSNVDRAPVVGAPAAATAAEGSALALNVTAADPDGEAIGSLTATGLPPGATFSPGPGNTTGTLNWTPAFDQAGTYTVTFTAANALSGSASTVITVINVDRAPVVGAPAAATAAEGSALALNVTAADPDGQAITSLTADLSGLPAGNEAVFTPGAGNTTGTLAWTPAEGTAGSYAVTFAASNSLSGSTTTSITVTSGADRAPEVTAPATAAAAEGSLLTVTVQATDPDGQAIGSLSADLSDLPAGNDANFTPGPGDTTGTLTWTPTYDDAGTYTVRFTAANFQSGSATTSITVSNVDRAPVVRAPATAGGPAASTMTFTVTATDPDGDAITSLTADLSGLPAGNDASFTPGPGNTTGTFTWAPTSSDAGSYTVGFAAANALAASSVTAISVTAPNQPPVATLTASPSTGNEPLTVTLDASGSGDPDGAIVSYRFDCGDGTVIGPQPGATTTHVFASGNWLSSVTVTDNLDAVASASQPITVAAVGSGPNLVGNPSFEVNTNGWGAYGGSTIQRVAGGLDGGYSLAMTGPASTATFGVNDSPNWVGTIPAAGTRYRLNGWVRSASAGGSSRLHLREYLNGVRVGASGYYSNSVKLSPSWTLIYEDYVAQSSGSTLDLQVEDVPLAFAEVFQVDNLSIRIVSSTPSAPALASQDPEAESRVQAWSTAVDPVLDLGASDPLWKVRFGATPSAPADPAARFTRFVLVYRGREVAASEASPLQDSADRGATDPTGILEITFDRAELRKLFAGLAPGPQSVMVAIVGERAGAPSEVAALAVQVAGAPIPLQAAVSPSPMRSEGLLEFATSRAGLLEVELLDLAGRRVRQLSNQPDAMAGWHRLSIDGRGDGGSQLKAGVYFYRIRAGEGTVTGRFVILR